MSITRTLTLCGLMCASVLSAQDVRGGVQAALAIPQADLSDVANMGLQVGGHARWAFGGGHGLMARGDFASYGKKDGVTTTALTFAADYTYHLDRNKQGFYLLAGLSHQSMNYSGWGAHSSDSGIGFDFGAGLDVNRNLGAQLRYTTHNLDRATVASLNLGVTWTF